MISQIILKEMHWNVFTAAQFKEVMALGFVSDNPCMAA